MKKFQTVSLGFYITNVCNLNCEDCCYFNNYAFAGHQKWSDYEQEYEIWAQRLDPQKIYILGGEPLSNPDWLTWVHGVARLWPNATIKINTNGTLLAKQSKKVYEELLPYRGRVYLAISGHDSDLQANEVEVARSFLQGDVVESSLRFNHQQLINDYQNLKAPEWPDISGLEDYQKLDKKIQEECQSSGIDLQIYYWDEPEFGAKDKGITFTDSNEMRITWSAWWDFSNAAIKYDDLTQRLTMYDSDPVKSCAVCPIKTCEIMVRGKWYKCPVMGILPEFVEQFPMELTQRQIDLIQSYQPAESTWSDADLEKFIHNIFGEVPIPQCSLCPEKLNIKQIKASNKKIKITKLKLEKT